MIRKPKTIHHRFKVQRRRDVVAHGRDNEKFLFSTLGWHTAAEADHKAVAENILQNLKQDQPDATFRVVEVWPRDAEPHVVIQPR